MNVPVHDCRIPRAREVGLSLAKALLDSYGNERLITFHIDTSAHAVDILVNHDHDGHISTLEIVVSAPPIDASP
jgi:hypothetical protein